jgi:precorrin-6B methylase 2
MLKRLDIGSQDVFIDFGSGKGRAVFTAALEFPFQRVTGVEIAPELHRQAVASISRNAGRLRCPNVDLVNADVVHYEIPDDVTIAYFDSPVLGDTFRRGGAKLLASVDRQPRALRLVYNFPFEHNRLLATGRVQVVDVQCSRWPVHDRSSAHVIVAYLFIPRVEVRADSDLLSAAPAAVRGAEQWLGAYNPGFRLVKHGRVHAAQPAPHP